MSRCTQWVDKGVIECKQWADRWTQQCHDWGEVTRRRCDEMADEGYNACSQYEDHGYQQCSSWSKSCSDWLPWPLSYICNVFEWVCDAYVWVSSWVCVAWVWVSNWVCKAWSYIVEYACVAWFWVVEAVCTVWSWVAKLVCIAWDNTRCALAAVSRGAVSIFVRSKRRQRKIKHVFVLMLENRSFDHMLGYSDISGTDAMSGAPTQINNLIGNPQSNIDPGPPVSTVNAATPAEYALSDAQGDPGHEFHNTLRQLCGNDADYPSGGATTYPPIDNSGFVSESRRRNSADPSTVMHVYTPEQLPILNTLASEFAICDNWFSSMPGPTWPNRLFVHAASSAGLDDSPGSWDTVTTTLIDGFRFDNGTVYDRLEDRCLDWLVFEGDETPQVFALSGMTLNALQGRFRDFEDFVDSVNDPEFPASYTFIEPDYGNIMPWTAEDFTCGNSQHPLDDVTRGEKLIKDVYEAVRNSPLWEKSAIIVTYDEHGGFFDHVPPPKTQHPGDSITDDENNHNNFDFLQLGVRVPAVVISPFTKKGTIDHQEYEHSSVIKTLGELFGLATLTERDRSANSLSHLFSLDNPRIDTPPTLPDIAESGLRCTSDDPDVSVGIASSGLSTREDAEKHKQGMDRIRKEYQEREIEPVVHSFMQIALRRYLSLLPKAEHDALIKRFMALDNSFDARAFIQEAKDHVRAYKRIHPPRKPWKRWKQYKSTQKTE